MTSKSKLEELDALIKLRVSQGHFEEAEELSLKLIEVAEKGDVSRNEAQPAELPRSASLLDSLLSLSGTTEQFIKDDEHLKLLSIFHYIVGGISAAYCSMALLHVGMGVAMLTTNIFGHGAPKEPAYIMLGVGSAVVLLGWLYGSLMIYSGRCIKRRKHYRFSMIMAIVSCMDMPLGTVLGVFTVLVLMRKSIKFKYGIPG